ncbi:metal ABC transporter permease [Candidatus Babeliales bacterium]|nr:metal ABC transporter permease [Candidatus Babeliales bacterium]MBP9844220.1 metal ABC transporter permease [Candidatus Babeliales bacterium]
MICTFYKIIIGTAIVGITTGIIGCFTLMNKQSLLGDTIAHATLPGLTGMFLLILQKSYILLLSGAATTGLLGAFCVHYITENTKLKKDAALGIVLSTFFGIGILFLTMIQKIPTAHQAGIDKFLFGQAATLLQSDIITLLILSFFIICTVIICWKELIITSFDPIYAQTIGLPVQKIQGLLIFLIVLTVIIGMQTVGLILMSSFLIAPAAAARQWTSKFISMIFLSILFSLLATTTGTIISYSYPHIATGPTIVILATTITLFSIIFSPSGILITKIKRHYKFSNTKAKNL